MAKLQDELAIKKFAEETFTDQEVVVAIEQFLDYGEQQLGKSQQGYFSGGGWAARCLRYHRKRLLEKGGG